MIKMGSNRFKGSKRTGILILLVGISLFPAPILAQDTSKQLSIECQHYLPGMS
jgi:hypothetical protein